MTYSYLIVTPTIRRPIIEILVRHKDKFAIYPVLIDSGADYCIFNLEIAQVFKIELSKARVKVRGVGRGKITGRWGEIDLRVANHIYKTSVLFAKINQFDHGILGQVGFFDHFDVTLSHQKQTIEIEAIKLTN